MLPLNRTKHIFAGLIVINLILITGFAGLYYLLDSRAQAANKLSAKIENVRNQKEREQTLESLVNDTAEARSMLDDYFVGENASADFITLVENIADDTRVELEIGSVTIDSSGTENSDEDKTEEGKKVTEPLVMEMQASGRWDQVVHFTRVLELLPQKTTIRNVSFSRSGGGPSEENQQGWSVTATIEAQKLTSE